MRVKDGNLRLFPVLVVLIAMLAGFHQESFANGTNTVGPAGRTNRPGDAGGGCAGGGCHTNQTATVTLSGLATLTPGQSSVYTVTAIDGTLTPNLRMGVDVATKKNTAGNNGVLSESAANLFATDPPANEVVHCTWDVLGCAPTPSLNVTGAGGSASYTFTFTMPASAVAGDKHTLYAAARLGIGSSGGSWNHAPDPGFVITTGSGPPPACNLDVDGSGTRQAFVDGILLVRYMLGLTGTSMTSGLTIPGPKKTSAQLLPVLVASSYDIDGSGAQQAFVDGIILVRLMLGIADANLLNGITLPASATFTTAAAIRANVNAKCGTSF